MQIYFLKLHYHLNLATNQDPINQQTANLATECKLKDRQDNSSRYDQAMAYCWSVSHPSWCNGAVKTRDKRRPHQSEDTGQVTRCHYHIRHLQTHIPFTWQLSVLSTFLIFIISTNYLGLPKESTLNSLQAAK